MILMFAGAQARRRRAVAVPTWIFVAGYILVWAAVGLAVYLLVQIGSDLATRLAPAGRTVWAPLAP
jgi:predicted metal-binding membrane protein